MTRRSFAVITSALCLSVVVSATGSPGHAQTLSCAGSAGQSQPLSCTQLRQCKQQKEDAHADAEAQLAGMTERETCLNGLRDAFDGDPPQLPEGTVDDFAACIDGDGEPTPAEAEAALDDLQTSIRQKREEVGNLLLEYEEVKQHYEDGCN